MTEEYRNQLEKKKVDLVHKLESKRMMSAKHQKKYVDKMKQDRQNNKVRCELCNDDNVFMPTHKNSVKHISNELNKVNEELLNK